MSDQVIYTVGGTVQAGGGTYISREADEELLRLCREGEFCYVLTPRQMGKSSLMVATMERLAAEGFCSVEIDLTQIGTELSGLTAEQWYLGLIDLIVDQLDMDVDYVAWWDERARLGPTQRLSQFLRQVVLEQVSEPVVIFIDEIDSTLNLDFTDDFFAAIRACYNARASDPAFKRLSFVLLGVATPGDLISDPQRTPFNIGRRMDLTDFANREAIPLAAGLGLPPVEAGQVLTWILEWTGGHPYLTQRLCAAAAVSPTKNWDAAAVDKLVEETFLGEQSVQDSNLRFVRDMLTQRAPDKAAVLKTYRRIYAGKAVPDEERSLAKTHLKLSGIVKAEDGILHIRNEIYRRVFNLAWVRESIPTNWTRIGAYILAVVALLAVGSILYNVWVGIRFQDCVANFYQTNAPEERVAHLAKIFRLQGLFGPTDYDYQARELFYGLSREEQLALFSAYDVEDLDLIVVVQGLYITLADTDGRDSTRPLLEAMVQALDYLNETEEANDLRNEINSWLEGRELARQEQYAGALVEYNKAIKLKGENPATLYERARVLTELSEYQQALSDLDQVMAIARRAPAPTPTAPSTIEPTTSPMLTPTNTPLPTNTPTPAPITSEFATPTNTPLPTNTPIPAPITSEFATPTNTPLPTNTPTPAPITSEFATIGQMISAVRSIIYGNLDLASSLASASSSEYPNLREFGLVPTLTPTPTPTQIVAVILPTDTASPTMTTAPEPLATNTPTIMPTTAIPAVVTAIRVGQPPTIDGRLDEEIWSQAQPLTYAVHPPANDSTTVVVRLLWDDKYLYAGFDVSDTQVEGSSATPWDGDSVSVIVINNGEQVREYRHSLLAEDRADRGGDAISEHSLKGATTFDNPDDQDEGYSIEMRISWVRTPAEGSTIAADFLSVDHDQNPGGKYGDPGTVFSKISWDGDGSVGTAMKSILLSGQLTPLSPTDTSVPPTDTSMPETPTTDTPMPTSTLTPIPTPSVVASKMVALKTYHNRYVTAMGADRDWVLRAETTELKDWEKFTLLCLDNGKVALETYHGRYVTAMNDEDNRDWVLRAETKTLSDWERFTLIEAGTGEQLPCLEAFELFGQGDVRIALKTHHGRYVTAMNDEDNRDWVLRAETRSLLDWEMFTVIPLPTVTPTDTPMRTATPTNTPTPIATPTPLPAPQLLDPRDAAMFVGHRQVLLTWEWIRSLGEDEYFSVRIRPEGDPKLPTCSQPHTKETQHSGNIYGCTYGRHYWSVIVVREDPESPTGWKEVSEASEERWFDFFSTD